MEVRKNDAMVAAHRSLAAMGETQDEMTRLSLWRCAKRYADRARRERAGLGNRTPHAAHSQTRDGALGDGLRVKV